MTGKACYGVFSVCVCGQFLTFGSREGEQSWAWLCSNSASSWDQVISDSNHNRCGWKVPMWLLSILLGSLLTTEQITIVCALCLSKGPHPGCVCDCSVFSLYGFHQLPSFCFGGFCSLSANSTMPEWDLPLMQMHLEMLPTEFFSLPVKW